MTERHITELHARLEVVSVLHSSVGDTSDIDELLRIIHNPGFTTPAELVLIHALVDSAERAAQQAVQAREGLLAGARTIAEATVSV